MTEQLQYYLIYNPTDFDHPIIGILYGGEELRHTNMISKVIASGKAAHLGNRPITEYERKWYAGTNTARLSSIDSIPFFICHILADKDASIPWLINVINKVLSFKYDLVPRGSFAEYEKQWKNTKDEAELTAILWAIHKWEWENPPSEEDE